MRQRRVYKKAAPHQIGKQNKYSKRFTQSRKSSHKLIKYKKHITKLADAREQIAVIQSMLQAKQRNLGTGLSLIAIAFDLISDVLYDLTGDKFYKSDNSQEGKTGEKNN